MNREDIVFSVTMTEDELRLFSEFLYDLDGAREDRRKTREWVNSWLQAESEKDAKRRMKDARNNLEKHHRFTKKYVNKINPEMMDLYEREDNSLRDAINYADALGRHGNNIGDIYKNEEKLKRVGYDGRYSAKGIEKLVGRQIDAEEAHNIIKKRSDLSDSYARKKGIIEKSERGLVGEVGRRWDDAKMVYGEALDGRSLGKDAALAAAGTAALIGGGIALRKHLKKKKQEKEIAEKKYKTSDKKKK
jgi:hypothetical protein